MSDPFELTEAAALPDTTANRSAVEPPYLTSLNETQVEAVRAIDGPLLVLAGAGTEKPGF